MKKNLEKEIENEVKKRLENHETCFSEYAFKSEQANYYRKKNLDIRPSFFHDTDSILYSRFYSRYIDKTQVFYLLENDHITHRVLHVQLVSKIAKTIGRFLGLNEDLIEAISLGHDVGHTPFGHNGETYINKWFQTKEFNEKFEHNIQSFRLFHEIENNGHGYNLSVQVLDGIICHNGEKIEDTYSYDKAKTKERLLSEYQDSMKGNFLSKNMIPMTLEACVMRISDIISYVGQDIKDAITAELISKNDIPKSITDVLGNNNSEVVNNLIIDLVNNSFRNDKLHFSKETDSALKELKDWNYKNIYGNPIKTIQDDKLEKLFLNVMDSCYVDLQNNITDSPIVKWAKGEVGREYFNKTSKERICADYVAGMTDTFLINSFKEKWLPKSFGTTFTNKNTNKKGI